MGNDVKHAVEDVRYQSEKLAVKTESSTLKNKVGETEQAIETVVAATEAAAASSIFSSGRTSIGGYGELRNNNGDDDLDQIDFHRFVLFFNHEFTDDLCFWSEFELEHSVGEEGKAGDVQLEQAYIEYDINGQSRVKGGVFLMPVGIINEMHEPDTFCGTERNPVEKNIIPSTWWEASAMFSCNIANGFAYDLAVTSGLDVYKKSDEEKESYKIRDGWQKVAKAQAKYLAYTDRVK